VGGKPVTVTDGTIDPTKVALFNLRNPVKQGNSNFTGQAGGQATGVVKAGSLEGSGVDPARAMVDLMASMRSMEATQRAITTIDQTLQQTSSQVGNLPG
jgi:flagellar basal-body rod protein FlgG